MITRHRRHSALKHLWMPLLTVVVLCYFGFHAFNGSFGIWALERLESQAEDLKLQLADLRREHDKLEGRVSLLRPASLDADMLDVQARSQLNLVRPDELVISFGAPQHIAE